MTPVSSHHNQPSASSARDPILHALQRHPILSMLVTHPVGTSLLEGLNQIDPVCLAAITQREVQLKLQQAAAQPPFFRIPEEERGIIVAFLWLWLSGVLPQQAFLEAITSSYPSLKRGEVADALDRLSHHPIIAQAQSSCMGARKALGTSSHRNVPSVPSPSSTSSIAAAHPAAAPPSPLAPTPLPSSPPTGNLPTPPKPPIQKVRPDPYREPIEDEPPA